MMMLLKTLSHRLLPRHRLYPLILYILSAASTGGLANPLPYTRDGSDPRTPSVTLTRGSTFVTSIIGGAPSSVVPRSQHDFQSDTGAGIGSSEPWRPSSTRSKTSNGLGDSMWIALGRQDFNQVHALGNEWLTVCTNAGWGDTNSFGCNADDATYTNEQWSKAVYAMLLTLRFDRNLWRADQIYNIATSPSQHVRSLAKVGRFRGFWDNSIPAHAADYALVTEERPSTQISARILQNWNDVVARLFASVPHTYNPHALRRYEEIATTFYNFAVFTSLAPISALRALESGCRHLAEDITMDQPDEVWQWYAENGPVSRRQLTTCDLLLEDLVYPAESHKIDLKHASQPAYPQSHVDFLAEAASEGQFTFDDTFDEDWDKYDDSEAGTKEAEPNYKLAKRRGGGSGRGRGRTGEKPLSGGGANDAKEANVCYWGFDCIAEPGFAGYSSFVHLQPTKRMTTTITQTLAVVRANHEETFSQQSIGQKRQLFNSSGLVKTDLLSSAEDTPPMTTIPFDLVVVQEQESTTLEAVRETRTRTRFVVPSTSTHVVTATEVATAQPTDDTYITLPKGYHLDKDPGTITMTTTEYPQPGVHKSDRPAVNWRAQDGSTFIEAWETRAVSLAVEGTPWPDPVLDPPTTSPPTQQGQPTPSHSTTTASSSGSSPPVPEPKLKRTPGFWTKFLGLFPDDKAIHDSVDPPPFNLPLDGNDGWLPPPDPTYSRDMYFVTTSEAERTWVKVKTRGVGGG